MSKPELDCNAAFQDDGGWVSWQQLGRKAAPQATLDQYPKADPALVAHFEHLLMMAKAYHQQTGRHLQIYNDIGQLYGAIAYGIKLGASDDTRIVRTFGPDKRPQPVSDAALPGTARVLTVRIDAQFNVTSQMSDADTQAPGSPHPAQSATL
ncbi:MAG: hypothetical protein JKX69_12000 [Rhodobacteraceae bacterium]|nr:hypothetical protein [Paracoccaceae bacterium]